MDKNFLLISFGRVFQILISLIAVRVFTTVLSTAEVGNIYLINAIVTFYGLALINPFQMYFYRRIYHWAEEKALMNGFFILNLYLLFISFLSLPMTYLLCQGFGMARSMALPQLMLFLVLYVYLYTWNQTILPLLNVLNHRTSFVVFTILTLSLGLGLSVLLVQFSSASALAWLSGQLAAQGLFAGIGFLYFRRKFPDRVSLAQVKPYLNKASLVAVLVFAFPLCLTNFFTWVQYQSYRIVVEKNVGLEYLGVLGLGLAIASSVAAAVESIVQQLYYPGYYREIASYDPEHRTLAWNKMAQLVLPIYASLTLMVSCLAPFLVNILATKKFSGAFVVVIYGAWIELFRMTTNLLASVAHAEMQTKYLVKAFFAGGILAVGGTFIASQTPGLHTLIPLILVASGALTVTVMYFEMKKLARFKVGIRQIRKAVLVSLPFALCIPIYGQARSLPVSLAVAFTMGSYFLLSQYLISKRSLAPASLMPQPAAENGPGEC